MPLPIPSGFINQTALAGALLIIPIVILYILKPKPKKIRFPTIMFIKRIEETKRFSSLFNKFIKDPLLLLQIIMILLLALSIANPYAIVEKPRAEDEAVAIIIDSSASMQATDVNPSRFEAAIGKAKDIVSNLGEQSEVSIVMAENIPITILRSGDTKKALDLLNRISCADTTTNIGDALILAKDTVIESKLKKTVYLISDFSKTEGDIETNKRILTLNGINIHLLKVNEEGKNLGIIDIDAKRTSMDKNSMYLSYTIKNYDEVEHEITHKVYVNDVLTSMQTNRLSPMSDQLYYMNFSITPDRQIITVDLLGGGKLGLDDRAYSVVPLLRTYRTMLLTSKDNDKFVAYAIDSQVNNRLRTVEPPVIPSLSEFDCIVMGGILENSILPGTFRDIKNFVESGKSLIIIASPDIKSIKDPNFEELMPVSLNEKLNLEKNPTALDHEILNDVSLENVVVKSYYTAQKKENATVIADIDGNPLIAYWSYGKGKVAYVGVNPSSSWSNFQYSSSFPIFWSQIIEYLNKGEEITKTLNFRTGEYLVLPKEYEITKPNTNRITTKSIFLDKQGFYAISGDKEEQIAVNLLDDGESDIRTALSSEDIEENLQVKDSTGREELFRYLLIIALILLIVEMRMYRRRGLL